MKPAECESIFAKDNSKTLSIQLETALGHFQQGKTHAALVRNIIDRFWAFSFFAFAFSMPTDL